MSASNLACAAAFSRIRRLLRWAEQVLPEDVYAIILKSCNKTFKHITIFVLTIVLPLLLLSVVILTSGNSEDKDKPANAAAMRTAKVGYDQELFWSYNKKAYEVSLEKCGIDPSTKPFTPFYIYVDENGQLLQVLQKDPYHRLDVNTYLFIGIFVFTIVITIIYTIAIRKRKFALPWYYLAKRYEKVVDLENFCAAIRAFDSESTTQNRIMGE